MMHQSMMMMMMRRSYTDSRNTSRSSGSGNQLRRHAGDSTSGSRYYYCRRAKHDQSKWCTLVMNVSWLGGESVEAGLLSGSLVLVI